MAVKAIGGYFKSVVEEGKKVVWPTREMIIKHTIMVVIVMILAAAVFGGIDYGFQQLVILGLSR